MTLKQMKAAILAQQDQEIEAAKEWCRGPEKKPGMLNAQLMPLWKMCTLDHENPVIEMMSRFAMIGIRQVLDQMED